MAQQARFKNRIESVMEHTSRYAFDGRARLAADAGVSESIISRLLSGVRAPSFATGLVVTQALERHLGRKLDPREVFSLDGTYPTASVCDLCGCLGCIAEANYDKDDGLRPGFLAGWSIDAHFAKTRANLVAREGGPIE